MPCTSERTLIKFVHIWRKISRKSGRKGDSERTYKCKGDLLMTVNGETIPYIPQETLAQLLVREQYNPAHVVIERNDHIVTKGTYDDVKLLEDDVIEVIMFMGGGC